MNILILHLSDIHLKSTRAKNKIMARGEQIAAALKRSSTGEKACFIVISGDVAFSGKEDQYEQAYELINQLANSLSKNNESLEIHVVAVPGNHDCDFDGTEEGMRPFLINSGALKTSEGINAAVVKEMASTQDAFFRFMSRVEKIGTVQSNNQSDEATNIDRLSYVRRFLVGGHRVAFHCFNAAWMSQINENQGQMVFPVHLVKEIDEDADVDISVFHHPDRWFESNNSRPFREYVERISDVIITGHEHVPGNYTKHSRTGSINEYVEGAALQDSDKPQVSGFNLVEIDLVAKKKRVTSYKWVKDLYEVDGTSEWRPFERNQSLRSKRFVNTPVYTRYLLETGTPFSHRSPRPLSLPDIFVYPELDVVMSGGKRDDGTTLDVSISSNRITSFAYDNQLLFITSTDQGGKTSLAKMLYRDLLDRGLVPVMINGAVLKSFREDELLKYVDSEFVVQYGSVLLERYRQLNRDQKLLIIDDFDHTIITHRQGHNLIVSALRKHLDRIIVLASDIFPFAELAQGQEDESVFNEFRHVNIMELGGQLRYRLITKWVTFDQDFTLKETEVEHQIQDYANKVSTLLLRKTVPATPVIVLSMLQMFDINQEVADKGEFGYFYEAYIKQKIAQSKSAKIEIGTIYGYTANLAYLLFSKSTRIISEVDINNFTSEYRKQYSMSFPQDTMLNVLEQAEVLQGHSTGVYRFKHRFVYYYFVAKYFQLNLYSEDQHTQLRQQIDVMIKRIHAEDYYFILLFLVYLTNDERIIKQLIGSGQSFYTEHDPCDLDTHVKHINNLPNELPPLSVGTSNSQENRDAYEGARDKAERVLNKTGTSELQALDESKDGDERNEVGHMLQRRGAKQFSETDEEVAIEEALSLNVAFRTMQLMGSVLRNFPGVLKGSIKHDLALESYSLGLRILRFMLVTIKEDGEYFRDIIAELITKETGITDTEQLEKRANSLMFQLQAGIGYSVCKKISQAVGSRHLKETYREVLSKDNKMSIRIIDTAIKLDHFINFPEDEVEELLRAVERNPFTYSILRRLVRDRFYLFTENRELRQSICAKLGISVNDPKMIEAKSKR